MTSHLAPLPLSRRAALKRLAAAAAPLALPRLLTGQAPSPITVRVSDQPGPRLAPDFMGLSYESSQLAHPSFFNSSNHDLVQFYRTLSPAGVLRLGGNLSEYTVWDAADTAVVQGGDAEGPDPGLGSARTFVITPRAIDALAGFLQATGWKLIYGLNLARGRLDDVVAEAQHVTGKVGPGLVALQFGNEPDLFKHPEDGNRKWTYEEFIAKWRQCYAAVRAKLPDVPIAGPDASNPRWTAQFMAEVGHEVVLETGHYYAEGPPTDSRMTIDYLLQPGERFRNDVLGAIDIARKSGVPYRMSEGNSCYNAGKAGVSDTFAAALWVLEFMASVALAGGTGVNLHGGGSGLYTPIAGSPAAGFEARPIFYGMLMLAPMLNGTLIKTTVAGGSYGVVAFASQGAREGYLIVLNRSPGAIACDVEFPGGRGAHAETIRLEAPSISGKTGVTLGGAQVTPQGSFRPILREQIAVRSGRCALRVAPYSAVRLRLPLA